MRKIRDTTDPTRFRCNIVILVLIAIAGTGVVAHYLFGFSHEDLSGHAWGSDDAYISYRYAGNLASGHGLVFNRGERVEGYTNFLYVLIAALFYILNPDSIYFGCFVLNSLALFATLWIFYRYLKANNITHPDFALALICLCPLMWAWPSSGLETSCVLFVQLSLVIVAESDSKRPSRTNETLFCLLAGTSILLRADGFVFPLLCTSAYFLRQQWRRGIAFVAIIVAFTSSYMVARHQYYGFPFPNTYYAKVTGELADRILSARKQLLDACERNAFFLYLLAFGFGWRAILSIIWRRKRYEVFAVPVAPVIATGLLGYWFYVGGDVFYERFLLVLIPLSVLHFFQHTACKMNRTWAYIVFLGIIALQFVTLKNDNRFHYQSAKYDRWIQLGRHLGSRHPQATLAVDAAGKVPFYSSLQTIDMLGLNDLHIGHSQNHGNSFSVGHTKRDPDYVLLKHPDFIAAWGNRNMDLSWGLKREKYLSNGYTLRYVVNSTSRSMCVNIRDVSGADRSIIEALHDKGYRYFVIASHKAEKGTSGHNKAIDDGGTN